MRTINEPDWKLLRQLHPLALERFCQRVLSDIEGLAQDSAKTNHERYLAIYRLIQQRDSELAEIFNDQRRSTAIEKLARMRALNLVTDDEMARFSPDIRQIVQFLTGLTAAADEMSSDQPSQRTARGSDAVQWDRDRACGA